MKPVKQTRTGSNGNCFQACVASVLELPLEAVPDFCNGADWFLEFSKWILQFNLSVIRIETGDFLQLQQGGFLKGAYMLAGGKSAVVIRWFTIQHQKVKVLRVNRLFTWYSLHIIRLLEGRLNEK